MTAVIHPRLARAAAVVALVAGSVAVGSAAVAGNTYVGFNTVAPVAQIPAHTPSQTKASTGVSGNISITSVGSSYETDALMCSAYGAYCGGGTKVYGIGDGESRTLPNSYTGGTGAIVAELRISTFNSVTVQIIGSWRSR